MSRSLDRLEESGYLVREKDPGCRRSYLICLTGDGAAEARRVRKVLEMVDEVIWNGLDQDEMEAFCGTMEKYAETWRNAILNLMSRKRKGKPPGQNRTIPAGRFSCLYVYFIHTISSVCRFHLLLVQICTDIIQHLFAEQIKGLLCSSGRDMGAEYARMANQFAGAVSQRALCITDKIIISLIQPCFQGRKVECRSDGGIEQDFPCPSCVNSSS